MKNAAVPASAQVLGETGFLSAPWINFLQTLAREAQSASDVSAAISAAVSAAIAAALSPVAHTGMIRLSSPTVPSGDPPVGSFYVYVDPVDNKLKAWGSAGTITVLALP